MTVPMRTPCLGNYGLDCLDVEAQRTSTAPIQSVVSNENGTRISHLNIYAVKGANLLICYPSNKQRNVRMKQMQWFDEDYTTVKVNVEGQYTVCLLNISFTNGPEPFLSHVSPEMLCVSLTCTKLSNGGTVPLTKMRGSPSSTGSQQPWHTRIQQHSTSQHLGSLLTAMTS